MKLTYDDLRVSLDVQRKEESVRAALRQSDDPIAFVFTPEFTHLFVALGQSRVRAALDIRIANRKESDAT